MDNKTIEQIAKAVAAEIMLKQEEYDKQFQEDFQNLITSNPNANIQVGTEDNELFDELEDLLSTFVDAELYEAAEAVRLKIKDLLKKHNM